MSKFTVRHNISYTMTVIVEADSVADARQLVLEGSFDEPITEQKQSFIYSVDELPEDNNKQPPRLVSVEAV